MKSKIKYLLCGLCLSASLPVLAQEIPTNAPAGPAVPIFFGTVTSYFSAHNTNLLTFQNEKSAFWVGADYLDHVNVSASLGIERAIYKDLSAEFIMRNAHVAGTIVSVQAGVGWNTTVHDTKLTFYLDGGHDAVNDRLFGELGARVKKALTDHTFAGVGIGARLEKKATPTLTIFTGFTF